MTTRPHPNPLGDELWDRLCSCGADGPTMAAGGSLARLRQREWVPTMDAMMMDAMSHDMMSMQGMPTMDMTMMQACMDACAACEQACTVCST